MRGIIVLLATVALAAVSAAGGSTASGAAPRPALRVLDVDVPTVRGTAFKPHEHVRLVILDGTRHVVRITAGTGGAFTKRVPGIDPGACTGFSVIATGDQGSRATFKRPPGNCQPPPA